ncbi:Twitchin [Phytophthora citrophthora]|uniref:Twitchin n=1 Tax=Phytophthora citrophthora TaxID=4793 RepID=A0AAD9H2L1_9STRA|nr:Twitchin [Phytophthora citrophthora]
MLFKGESAPGEIKSFQTTSAIDLPSSPLNLRATQVTAGNIKLEWDAPADFGGASDVVGYIVYQKITVSGAAFFTLYDGQDSKERSFVARELMRGSSYAFAVVALNDASFCADPSLYNLSSFLEVTTLAASRVAPARDLFVLNRTGGSITLVWKAPDDLAGLPLLEYIVELESPTNDYEVLADSLSSGQTQYTHYGLSESTTYNYVVTAVNEDGPSVRSAIFTATTTSVSMPGAIQNVNYINASGGSITLVWDAPLDTGGRRIERYEISRPGRSFSSNSTVFEDHISLSSNTWYTYTVSAFNGYYRGYSASVWASTGNPSLPDPPQMNAIPFGGRLEVSWATPENTGGVPISQYLITLLDADGSTTIESTSTLTLNYTFWGLLARTHYKLTGKSSNDFGDSVLVSYDVVIGPPDAPTAPPQPTASNIHGGRVDIQTEGTKYTGGEEVSLILYMDGKVAYYFPAVGGETTIYGLVAETEYIFKVSAKNSVAETRSAALKVTTTEISTPGQIQNLQLVSVTYSVMLLTWDDLQDTGGDSQLQYKVIYVKCSSDGTPTANEQSQIYSNSSVVVDKLDYPSFYNVSVVALTSTSLLGMVSFSILVKTQQPLDGVVVAGSHEVTVVENAGFVSIPIERVGGSFGTISYSYMMTDESAIHGVNYEQTGAIIELNTNVQSDDLNISILNDNVYNPGITFLVTIIDLNTGRETSTRVILEDDGDAGFVSFTQSSLALLENSGVVSLDIVRTGGSSPPADIQVVFVHNSSSVERFRFLGSTIPFDIGDTQKTISVQIVNDIAFQFVPDSISIGLQILDGGVLHGEFSTITLTALDDGDISVPKECVNVRQTSVTGGALGLEWAQPIDRGGANITLSFVVTVLTSNQAAITQYSETESTVVYGLSQRTSYQVFVNAKNSVGLGVASTSSLLSTTSATAPTAPFNIQLLSISSSSLQFKWLAPLDDGGSPIVAYTVYKVSTTASTTSRSTFSSILCSTMTVCTIKQLQALTNYSIQIQASSAFVTQGSFSDVVTFTTTSPDYPDSPPIANVTWVSAGAMTIHMFDPVNVGGSDIQEYLLYIRGDLDPEFALIYSGTLNEHTVYHLRYQTAYYIKYQVVNSVGPSSDSPIKIYKTLQKSLPSAPLNVEVVNKTGGAIALSWDEPLDVGGQQITGYAIKIVSISGTSAAMVGYDGKSLPSRQGTLYGLTADTGYGMQVVAYLEVSNCFEPVLQAWSVVVLANTMNATSPGSAPELLVGRYTGGIIQLVWIAPKDQGGVPLTGYTLNFVDDVGNSSVLFSTTNATILSFVHNDLMATTKYSYSISTSNSVGSSPTSPVLVATTDMITFPSAPLNVQQLAYTTGGAITVGWDRSIDTGGQPIAGYVVYRNAVAVSTTLPPAARSFVNRDGLSASSSYIYTVRTVAQNLMVSMASDDCTAKTTEATKPQKAQSLSAIPGSSYLNVSWVPDGDTGGLPILSYDVKLMLGSTVVESVNLKTDRSYLFAGLTANTAYSGYIKINNDRGASEELSADLTTTNLSVPSAPEMPSVRSIFGGNFTIQVQPPRFTGGSAISSMKVYEYIGGALSLKVTLSGSQTSYTFYGVSASSKYFVACSAINSAGEGPLSAITTVATTPINQPGPILTAPTFVGATGTSLSFSWSPPVDSGGSQTLTYVVRVANGSVETMNPTTELSYTAKQLSYGSSYDFYVRAKNNIGDGTWSPITTATTQPDAAGEFNFAQTNVSVLENATQVALLVQRTSGLSGRITLTYSAEKTGAQPATVGSDYAVVRGSSTTTGSIVFESLQSEASIVIFIIDDPDYEPDETFAVRITALTSGSVGTPVIGSKNMTVVTIVDDGDAGYISFEKPAYSFAEDARTGTVVIIREYGKSTNITLTFDFLGGTATPDVDYRKTTTPVVMDNGVTKATLTFSIINDKIFEYPDEYFNIRMSVTGGAILRQPQVRVTITDDGDVSNPGTCPPPELQTVTGGLATFLARLPDHNGSTTGLLANYIVRLSTETTSIDFNMSATRILSVGNLTALTAYSVIIAPSSPYGQGSFSSPTQFSTTNRSLPGAASSISVQSRTGGQISLVWSQPADTGGIPISKYRVEVIGFPEVGF